MNLPMVVPDREPLTEAEARRLGASAHAILNLRHAIANAKSGTLCVQFKQTYGGGTATQNIALYQDDLMACLSLLLEREAQFLTSFNVKLDETPK